MRFGCCGSLVAQNPDKTGVEIVEKLLSTGMTILSCRWPK